MADINDIRLQKQARIQFMKHSLDLTMADVRVTYGTCFVTGRIRKVPKSDVKNVEQETMKVCDILRRVGGIKEVILQNCTFDEDMFK